jgi:DegV family protein with EDD domain
MRGGRITKSTALLGNLLGVKPILHVDNDGKLTQVGKVRGRQASILRLAEEYQKKKDPIFNTVYISHADCINDANKLKSILQNHYSADVRLITDIGPVIGAHSGPGTLALFFVGKER